MIKCVFFSISYSLYVYNDSNHLLLFALPTSLCAGIISSGTEKRGKALVYVTMSDCSLLSAQYRLPHLFASEKH